MTDYVLWNKKDKRLFKHPRYGIWSTDSKQLAEETLLDLHDALDGIGMGHVKENITYVDVEEIKEYLN